MKDPGAPRGTGGGEACYAVRTRQLSARLLRPRGPAPCTRLRLTAGWGSPRDPPGSPPLAGRSLGARPASQ